MKKCILLLLCLLVTRVNASIVYLTDLYTEYDHSTSTQTVYGAESYVLWNGSPFPITNTGILLTLENPDSSFSNGELVLELYNNITSVLSLTADVSNYSQTDVVGGILGIGELNVNTLEYDESFWLWVWGEVPVFSHFTIELPVSDYNADWVCYDGQMQFSAPEPASLVLLLMGVVFIRKHNEENEKLLK